MSAHPLAWLRRHPFPVEAYFDRSAVLTYAFPPTALRDLLPRCLTLDTHRGEHAFVAVAAVQTRGLRPKGLPRWLGRDFLLMGYRIFVRYQNRAGRRLRGLYILRSETDSRSMAVAGNLVTRYRYVRTDVRLTEDGDRVDVRCDPTGLRVRVDGREELDVPLPAGSPFESWAEARPFAGPLPFTFSVEDDGDRVVIIQGVRSHWEPSPVRVLEHRVPFVQQLTGHAPVLASAFQVREIPYWWKKGVVERWTG